MDTTRRTILRGLAAAPLAATAGGLLVPSTAHAAPGGFALAMRLSPSEYHRNWSAAADTLRRRLQHADLVRDVLRQPKRAGGPVGDWRDGPGEGVKPTGFDYGFSWDPDTKDPHGKLDGETAQWYPQGISTSVDGYGGTVGGKKVVAVSWYGYGDYESRGARISFIDVTGDPQRPRYQHVLLVEPVQLHDSDTATFNPVIMHAGGVAWVGDFLYVANLPGRLAPFKQGGVSAFDLSRMVKVAGADKRKAFGYDYVLPLHHLYENQGGSTLRHSQLSLDRTRRNEPRSLVVSEFQEDRVGRVVRWSLGPSGYLADGRSDENWTSKPYVQGAVAVGNDAYYAANDRGTKGPDDGRGFAPRAGQLWLHKGRTGSPARSGTLAIGPEDLSYDAGRLWCLAEHPDLRRVYRIKLRR
ncbi:hypothetical protein [Streptomyces cinnamoneus]|uniref:Secreted protein n=1 Tax=Streptomyces cinnamoneus TaxID=53446 RepID=A0A918WD37_STRCJ|nr:hypothetical protein [Streptomyces cinnamoneus]GHC39747.1 hypothetical protein GCM10010507_12100 [Streptomyces cinnamoneus]